MSAAAAFRPCPRTDSSRPGQPRDEPLAAGVGLGQHPSEQVDDDAGPAGRLAMRGEDAEQTARA